MIEEFPAIEEHPIIEPRDGFMKGIIRGVTRPIVESMARPIQLAETGLSSVGVEPYKTAYRGGSEIPPLLSGPLRRFYGDIPTRTPSASVGTAIQAVAPFLGPMTGGGMFFGGQAMEDKKTGGGIAAETAKGILLGKGTELVTRGGIGALSRAGKAIPEVLKRTSADIINSLIRPTQKMFNYGKNPGAGVAKEGIVFKDMNEGIDKVSSTMNNIDKERNAILTSAENQSKRINVEDVLGIINRRMEQAAVENDQVVINRLSSIRKALTDNLATGATGADGVPQIVSTGTRNLKNLTPLEATKLKSLIGGLKKWTGNPTEDKIVNKTIGEIYGALKNKINAAVPESAPLTERWSNLIDAKIAMQHRLGKATSGAMSFGLRATGYPAIVYGIATGHPQTIIAGIAELGVDKILKSSVLKTNLANALYKMSAMERNAILQQFPKLKVIAPYSRFILQGKPASNE